LRSFRDIVKFFANRLPSISTPCEHGSESIWEHCYQSVKESIEWSIWSVRWSQ
jgi:hypothetical protein